MPGPLLHTIFGRDVFHCINNNRLKKLLQENWDAYLWGLQGPDLY